MGLKGKIGLILLGAALKAPIVVALAKQALKAVTPAPPPPKQPYSRPRTHVWMSEPERAFRLKHFGHIIQLRESSPSGVGLEIKISCDTCLTDVQDVTDVETW
jgi:hypothetical protein